MEYQQLYTRPMRCEIALHDYGPQIDTNPKGL